MKLPHQNNRCSKLLADCIVDLLRHKINIHFVTAPRLFLEFDKTYVKGAWADNTGGTPSFYCSIHEKTIDWIKTFVHEYSHFCQWKEKSPAWKLHQGTRGSDLDKIVHNRPIKLGTLRRILQRTRDVELDAEIRAVKLIKRYNLPLNLKNYIRTANVYIHFYNYLETYRQWYKCENEPYANKHLLSVAAPYFYKNYDTIPPKMLELFKQYYPPVKRSNILN